VTLSVSVPPPFAKGDKLGVNVLGVSVARAE